MQTIPIPVLCILFFTPFSSPYIVTPLLPYYHPMPPYSPLQYLPLHPLPSSPYELGSDQKFSATPESGNYTETVGPTLYASLFGQSRSIIEMNMCYFLGNDILKSHVPCNPNWGDNTEEGVRRYINEMTLETNKLIGLSNMLLSWKGPYQRSDYLERYPTDPAKDTLSTAYYELGCDVVVFLVFNEYENCEISSTGHKYGGLTKGAMCEASLGTGYAVVVDQGFLKDVWTGPQLLAHHLLVMLTSDLNNESKHCPNKDSLLYPSLYPGLQRVDQCVADKLTRSKITDRKCLKP